MNDSASPAARLHRVILDGEAPNNLSPFIEADREQAVADLAAANHFAPLIGTDNPGPYSLHLSILEGRLIFDVRDVNGDPLTAVGLALGPFRRLVKDYEMLVDSHIKAVEEGREQRIQAIVVGIMPWVMFLIMFAFQPATMKDFYFTPLGICVLLFCTIWISIGMKIVNKLGDITV